MENGNFFQPMLASKFMDLTQKQKDELFEDAVYVQPKLDGMRCIVKKDGMFTRTGKKIISCPHIWESIKPVFDIYPSLILDGELYNHFLTNGKPDFNKLMSLVRKTKPSKEDLEESRNRVFYYIYDCVFDNHDCYSDNRFYVRMLWVDLLFASLKTCFEPFCKQVFTIEIKNIGTLWWWFKIFVDHNYEGLIVRKNAQYENKRSGNLLKVKRFKDDEYPIIRIEEGKGKLKGLAGNVVVNVDGKEVSAGINCDYDTLRDIWNRKEEFIGKMATIAYFDKTDDGSLRFPKCIDIGRDD